jgi:hypothetical protein
MRIGKVMCKHWNSYNNQIKCFSFQCATRDCISFSSPVLERTRNECPNCHPSLLQTEQLASYDELKPCASPTTHLEGISSSKYHFIHLRVNGNGRFFFCSNLLAHFGAMSLSVMFSWTGRSKACFRSTATNALAII